MTPPPPPSTLTPADCADAAATLRRVVQLVDAGDLDAEPSERAYLAAAVDTTEQLAASVGTRSRAVSWQAGPRR